MFLDIHLKEWHLRSDSVYLRQAVRAAPCGKHLETFAFHK